MRFLFAGWFSATADRYYSAKLRCGKREALFWQVKNRSRPRKIQSSLDYENEDDDEDEISLSVPASRCAGLPLPHLSVILLFNEQTVLHHHGD
jgi:hypothetical protein